MCRRRRADSMAPIAHEWKESLVTRTDRQIESLLNFHLLTVQMPDAVSKTPNKSKP